jgi:hypothetical protein
MKSRTVSLLVLGTLLALLLEACSPASPASQPPSPRSTRLAAGESTRWELTNRKEWIL